MKKQRTTKPAAAPAPARAPVQGTDSWRPWILAGAAALVAFLVYRPALDGDFVFDDRYLPILADNAVNWPLSLWLGRVRPVLMFGFWLQLRLFGLEPYSYHLVNFLLHVVNSALVLVILRRLLCGAAEGDSRNTLLAGFGATLFLLHPLQTESVSYVASRSEALSATFFLGAVTLFVLRRSQAASFVTAAAALALFGAAVTTKEHTIVLPAVFLLADYYWNPGFSFSGIRRNWRLYVPLSLAGLAGLAFVRYGLRSLIRPVFAFRAWPGRSTSSPSAG